MQKRKKTPSEVQQQLQTSTERLEHSLDELATGATGPARSSSGGVASGGRR